MSVIEKEKTFFKKIGSKILSFLKKLGKKILELLKKLGKKILDLLIKIKNKIVALVKKVLAKIRKALREKKCGRPLVIEQPFYASKEGFKSFFKGLKEGNLAYKLKRDLFADCDITEEEAEQV